MQSPIKPLSFPTIRCQMSCRKLLTKIMNSGSWCRSQIESSWIEHQGHPLCQDSLGTNREVNNNKCKPYKLFKRVNCHIFLNKRVKKIRLWQTRLTLQGSLTRLMMDYRRFRGSSLWTSNEQACLKWGGRPGRYLMSLSIQACQPVSNNYPQLSIKEAPRTLIMRAHNQLSTVSSSNCSKSN